MPNRTVLFVSLVVVFLAAFASDAEDQDSIPPGVDAEEWMPISKTLGLALSDVIPYAIMIQQDREGGRREYGGGRSTGVLYAKVDGFWVKVHFENQERFRMIPLESE